MKIALIFLIFCGVSYANTGVNFFKVRGHDFGKSRTESKPAAIRSSRPSPRPQFQQHRFEPLSRFQSDNRPSGFSTSGKSDVDGTHSGSEYNYSWRHTGKHTKWDWGGAVNYCTKLSGGWEPISINDESENNFVSNVIGGERVDYIWTGGRRSGGGWKWPKGQFKNIAWSHTGGFKIPQPDNREGNEDCLSVLNNIYGDGIKWHDVACSHRKPIICERPARN
ncbi:UNVERIFIED_CONTAM: hypothetical protein RMT77_001062 [Armadillidium vulgare]